MQTRQRIVIATIVGVLGVALSRIVLTVPSPPRGSQPRGVAPPRPRSASEQAREEARRWYNRAVSRSRQEEEGMEAWDAPALARLSPEDLRRSTIARAPELSRALVAAERAARLATTHDEKDEAALLLALVDRDSGYPDRELAEARKLMSLAPSSLASLKVLRGAAGRNGLVALARQADAAIAALSEKDKARGTQSGLDRFRLWNDVDAGKGESP